MEKLSFTLSQNRQAVIFLNKRGYAGATMCRFCGHTFGCDNCSANMKVHGQGIQKLVCHICHLVKSFPKSCPDCRASDFKFVGWGTQQIEEMLQKIFPEKKIFRADSDALGGKYAFDKLIKRFHNHEADILLGTQMIAKGLDFEKVDLVGLILADIGLNLPDFRSEERVFQLLNQVSGRAGRRDKQGEIVVQTFDPDHEVFMYLVNHDVEGFLEQQIVSRKKIKMPPFASIAKITFSDKHKSVAFNQAKEFHNLAQSFLTGKAECFWAPAFFPRIYNKYHFHVFIKSENEAMIRKFLLQTDLSKAKVDMKPVSLL